MIFGVMGVSYFLIYPLSFSPLQPNQYTVPNRDLQAYAWMKGHTLVESIGVVSLNESEYNPHELTVFAERKALIDSPMTLESYRYPQDQVRDRLILVKEIYSSGLSDESLKQLREYTDKALGSVPVYVFIGSHELERYPPLARIEWEARNVVYNSGGVVIIRVV